MIEFVEFPKMGRLTRECVVTEKIDGTNAQILITQWTEDIAPLALATKNDPDVRLAMLAGSRTRYLTTQPGSKGDNFGFAAWVTAHADELWSLGLGRHYGEWWGSGVQRGYGLQNGEKRFSLFNVARWHRVGDEPYVMVGADPRQPPKVSTASPACCHVVPVLYRGMFAPSVAENMIQRLSALGSAAAPGFMDPEGIVIFHTAAGTMFKKTIDKDEEPKSKHAQSLTASV